MAVSFSFEAVDLLNYGSTRPGFSFFEAVEPLVMGLYAQGV